MVYNLKKLLIIQEKELEKNLKISILISKFIKIALMVKNKKLESLRLLSIILLIGSYPIYSLTSPVLSVDSFKGPKSTVASFFSSKAFS